MRRRWIAYLAAVMGAAAAANGQIAGDANLDGYVNIRDLVLIATNYEMEPATRSDGDVTGDGRVDGADFTIIADMWGTGGTAPPVPQPWQIWAEHDGGVAVPGLPGYKAYTVSLLSDDPANPPAAWQGSFDGPMNQEWYGMDELGIVIGTTPIIPDLCIYYIDDWYCVDAAKDSHFLLYEGDFLAAEYPNEWHDYLRGRLALWADARQQQLPFAQLVIADGQQVAMSGVATDPYGQGLFATELIIPEPSFAALFVIGLVALLRRGRA